MRGAVTLARPSTQQSMLSGTSVGVDRDRRSYTLDTARSPPSIFHVALWIKKKKDKLSQM